MACMDIKSMALVPSSFILLCRLNNSSAWKINNDSRCACRLISRPKGQCWRQTQVCKSQKAMSWLRITTTRLGQRSRQSLEVHLRRGQNASTQTRRERSLSSQGCRRLQFSDVCWETELNRNWTTSTTSEFRGSERQLLCRLYLWLSFIWTLQPGTICDSSVQERASARARARAGVRASERAQTTVNLDLGAESILTSPTTRWHASAGHTHTHTTHLSQNINYLNYFLRDGDNLTEQHFSYSKSAGGSKWCKSRVEGV